MGYYSRPRGYVKPTGVGFVRTYGNAECPECFGVGGHFTNCDKCD